jgi:hypothetical protein
MDGHGETSIPPYNFVAEGINSVIINKTKYPFPKAKVTLANLGYPVLELWFSCSYRFSNYVAFLSLGFESTKYMIFQKYVVHTKFDIYIFITITGLISLLVDYLSAMIASNNLSVLQY